MDKRVFETEYAQFCCELAKTYVLEENNDYEILSGDELLPVRVLMSFFFEILLHSKEKGIMIGYCHNIIVNFLSKSVPACRWFLSICTRDSLKRWLLECTEDEARGYAVEVICSAITKVLPLEQELLQNNEGDCSRICDIMLSFVKQLPHYWRTFKQFFIFFEKWVLQGSIERDYLVKRDFIKYTSNLIEYGTVDRSIKAPVMGDKFSAPEFSSALATLSILVRCSEIDNDSDDEIDDENENEKENEYNLNDNPFSIPGTKIDCDPEEFIFLQRDSFLHSSVNLKATDRNLSGKHLGEMIAFMSWNRPKFSNFYEKYLCKEINDVEHNQLPSVFEVVTPFISLDDSLKEDRVNAIMIRCIQILDKFKKYPKYTKALISSIYNLYANNVTCRTWLQDNHQRWRWTESWMTSHGHSTAILHRDYSKTNSASAAEEA